MSVEFLVEETESANQITAGYKEFSTALKLY